MISISLGHNPVAAIISLISCIIRIIVPMNCVTLSGLYDSYTGLDQHC